MAAFLSQGRIKYAGINYFVAGTAVAFDVAATGTPVALGNSGFTALESPNADDRANFTVTVADGTIDVVEAGLYLVMVSTSGAGDAADHIMHFELFVDGSASGFGSVYTEDATAIAAGSTSFFAVQELAGGESLDVRVDSNANGDDWDLESFQFIVIQLASRA